ncbi:MAG TPA: hypothetical protein VFV02_09680 [Acidimicrobiales bacterium]|nr:hypothetical protein [Acidimicrobiales bacterium]
MGLMDKVKMQAEQAVAKAQQGMNQGQAKIDQLQAKRQWDGLLRDLGEAYYAQLRQGASRDAVDSALAALDSHAAQSAPGTSGGTTSADSAPPGDYGLGDL